MSTFQLLRGDCRAVLAEMEPDQFHACVCDPPYELNFMGSAWDRQGVAFQPETWQAVLRPLRPGGFLVAFGGDRTQHRLVCAIEDAGFEIRRLLLWIYATGFPKSLAVGKAIDRQAGAERPVVGKAHRDWSGSQLSRERQDALGYRPGSEPYPCESGEYDLTAPATPEAAQWEGFGTDLKPAVEVIVLARKPLSEPTVAANVLRWGTGALNVDGCRIGTETMQTNGWRTDGQQVYGNGAGLGQEGYRGGIATGRYPSNLLLGHTEQCDPEGGCQPGCPVAILDGQAGESRSVFSDTPQPVKTSRGTKGGAFGNPDARRPEGHPKSERHIRGGYTDSGSASRFFAQFWPDPELDCPFLFVPKPSRAERDAGCEHLPERMVHYGGHGNNEPDGMTQRLITQARNIHPTVKPVALLRYLCRLVTAPGGAILDAFCGSGSTIVAALLEGFCATGIDLDADGLYLPIAQARCEYAGKQAGLARPLVVSRGKARPAPAGQGSLF